VNGIAWVSAYQDQGITFCDEGYLGVECPIGIESPLIQVMPSYKAEYTEKRLLHNAPHAVLAYLGWKGGCSTIPEAMWSLNLDPLWVALSRVLPASGAKLGREMARFADRRFPDPISRVARSPWRKLARGARLPLLYSAVASMEGAASLVMNAIDAAIEYGLRHDGVVSMLVHQCGVNEFKQGYCGLEEK